MGFNLISSIALTSMLVISIGCNSDDPNASEARREIEQNQSERYSGGAEGTSGSNQQEDSLAKADSGKVWTDPTGVNSQNPGQVQNQGRGGEGKKTKNSDATTRENANEKNTITPNPPDK